MYKMHPASFSILLGKSESLFAHRTTMPAQEFVAVGSIADLHNAVMTLLFIVNGGRGVTLP
jgi:hypothetical protein